MSGRSPIVTDVLRRFKQPEYTGENRCSICTVINTGIALVVASGVALVSIPGAVAVFGISLVVIAVRGYLVPGTPTLVTFLPHRIHHVSGPGPGPGTGHESLTQTDPSFDVETTLKAAAVIEDCEQVDDLCLTDSYRRNWHARMATLTEADAQCEQLATALSVSPDEIEFEEADTGWHVYIDGVRAGGWQSEAAFVADLASEELLAERIEDWDHLSDRDSAQLLVALRSFVEECPHCGGEVVADEAVTKSCCRDDIVSVTTSCVECDSVVFTGTEN